MRKPLLLGLLAALVAALVSAGPALSARKKVEVDDNYFAPRTVAVHRGDRVVWAWEGRNPHNVTVSRGPVKFRSDTQKSGRYTKRLTRRGTYKIVCTLHRPSMRMTLRVR
jgi:plastocyanin